MGTLFGVPITRIIVFGGLYWGPPILGNCHICPQKVKGYPLSSRDCKQPSCFELISKVPKDGKSHAKIFRICVEEPQSANEGLDCECRD